MGFPPKRRQLTAITGTPEGMNRALTPFRCSCYGFHSEWSCQSRKYLLLFLAVLVVAFFIYKFRNSIALQGFRWTMVMDSLRQARLSLLLLSILAIFACYALRSLRWMRFLSHAGKN